MANDSYAPITAAELDWARAARAAHPEMTSYGFPPYLYRYTDGWAVGMTDTDFEEVAISRRRLERCRPWRVKATSDCIGSYGAKHCAESWSRAQGNSVTYVKEGALLLAAVALGVPLLRYPAPSWGAYLGLSKRALRANSPQP